VGAIVWESIHRLGSPAIVRPIPVLIAALLGVIVNGLSALAFHNRGADVNVRAAFVHLLGDAAASAGVAIAALGILLFGWTWLDPVCGLIISAAVLFSARSLFKESLDLALDAVPVHIEPERVRGYLENLPGVKGVHDLHIWAMSTTEVALTAHLIVSLDAIPRTFLREVMTELHDRFRIEHATLQLEANDPCAMAEHC
jgi:cobalt-zinc-cadmium efflux system protein